jgi:hypothetical protein
VTPLVGQVVVDIGADYVGIRTVNGEVVRFDARGVIRWSPLAPRSRPPPSLPTTGKTSGTPTEASPDRSLGLGFELAGSRF